MTEIPEIRGGDIEVLQAKVKLQAETIRQQREALREAREIIVSFVEDAYNGALCVVCNKNKPGEHLAGCEVPDAEAWLAAHKEE